MALFMTADFGMAAATNDIRSTYDEHTRGVQLARAGQYDDGLAVLLPLLARFPDDYPLQRDVIVITLWKGDCDDALKRFQRIRHRPDLEPYLVVPVSDCLLAANRPKEARRLVRRARQKYPDNAPLLNAFLKVELVLRIDENIDEERPAAAVELTMDESDQGQREWILYAEGSARVAENTRLYARSRMTRATETGLRSGDLDRAGVGVRYRLDERWLLDQEFSADLRDPGERGTTTQVLFEPRDDWRFSFLHTSFAEAIPVRARAAGIDARQLNADAEYESRDYRWFGLITVNGYDFSDTNRRVAGYVRAGHAYEMRIRREQRLYAEAYRSSNTLDKAVYYNPARDQYLGLLHQTDFIYDSRFKRHVDHLWLGAGMYTQKGFGSHARWSARYEQDYDFDESRALVAGVGMARNVYDGKYETELQLYIYYHQRF